MPFLRLTAPALAAALALGAGAPARPLSAQAERVTREQVVARAIARGPRLAIARADSGAARAQLGLARQYENPLLGLAWSKSAPQQHLSLDLPLDFPWLRTARIGAAEAGLGAAAHRFAFLREAVVYDADTTYTRALAAAARARLSKRTAVDADSLLVLARLRRDAGDASELDVQLATVSGGQLANAAAADSLEAIGALLAVQAVMGMPADLPTVALADTLASGAAAGRADGGTPLLVAAAEEDVRSAELALKLEQRRLFPGAALSIGYETRDPTGSEPGTLPVIGLALPIPLFNQNAAGVELARAQRDRALAELSFERIEVNAALARARRASTVAQERVARSQRLLQGANQVAALSLLAYREGAATLASALEAQRTARDVQAQYVEDVALARNTAGLVRLLTLTANRPEP